MPTQVCACVAAMWPFARLLQPLVLLHTIRSTGAVHIARFSQCCDLLTSQIQRRYSQWCVLCRKVLWFAQKISSRVDGKET